jgi:segregation and condensation protein B
MNVTSFLKAVIFASPDPISVEDLCKVWEEFSGSSITNQEIQQSIQQLIEEFADDGIILVEMAGGFRWVTHPNYHDAIGILLKNNAKRRLSPAALETLALIAYKQPVTKGDLEYIRGVNCDSGIHKLLERDLIKIVGKGDGPGKPILYGTSDFFMEYFGIKDLTELPSMDEIKSNINEIGQENA